jgi:hypothetical protein
MTQTTIFDYNNRPLPADLFNARSQNYRVYERLLRGSITNGGIVRELGILKYTSRLTDVRKALKPYLMDIRAERVGTDGVFEYSLVY